ncbi:C-4 sterol methyl oxidase [Entophlyctis luteolus]|nr:C-4 sterol methyl oxidase [Entophlyctis luteolus]
MSNFTATPSASMLQPMVPPGYIPTSVEAAWFDLFTSGDMNPSIKLAAILFAWHEFVFYSRYLPYAVLDYIPSFRKYRIQASSPALSLCISASIFPPDKVVSGETLRYVLFHITVSQFTIQLPLMMLFKPITEILGMRFLEAPFPSIGLMMLQCFFFVVVEDTYHYWFHRLLHQPSLYKYIHKDHHLYQAPFGIAAEYASVSETIILGLGFFIGPVIWSYFTMGEFIAGKTCSVSLGGLTDFLLGNCGSRYASTELSLHVICVFAWLGLRLTLTVDNHCGYDFPWSIRHWIPVWAGADWHDYHHLKFIGNYGSTFRHWDWIAGTDSGYNKYYANRRKNVKAE